MSYRDQSTICGVPLSDSSLQIKILNYQKNNLTITIYGIIQQGFQNIVNTADKATLTDMFG